MPSVELLTRNRPPGAVDVPHGHREHVIMCTSGKPVNGRPVRSRLASVSDDREWSKCPAGHVTFLPAGFGFSWEWTYSSTSIHIAIPPERLAELTLDALDGGSREHPGELRPVFREFDGRIANLLYCLRDEVGMDGLGADLVTSSLLTALGVQILRLTAGHARSRAPSPSGDTVKGLTKAEQRRAVELLTERMRDKFPLRELAAEFDRSPYHFSRQFKQAMGLPPHQFQLQLRIRSACKTLRTQPDRNVADIACDLGFADESHFRRHFKRIVGITPSAYRQQ
jgi:AraC family transcriptional regulator